MEAVIQKVLLSYRFNLYKLLLFHDGQSLRILLKLLWWAIRKESVPSSFSRNPLCASLKKLGEPDSKKCRKTWFAFWTWFFSLLRLCGFELHIQFISPYLLINKQNINQTATCTKRFKFTTRRMFAIVGLLHLPWSVQENILTAHALINSHIDYSQQPN